MNLWETMLYNENFLTTLDPMSYMHLNMDFSQLKYIKNELFAVNISSADKQQICEKIANYLYYCTDTAFYLEYLSDDIVKLEALFHVDLKNLKGKRHFN